MKTLTVGSLFSGIGGIELGFESTGRFETIWFVEKDEYASAVLKKHWPEVPNHGDITKVKWSEIERPDVLTGGFPCQDVSYAGKGRGIVEGERSGLWSEFSRCLRMVRPQYSIVENVPGLCRFSDIAPRPMPPEIDHEGQEWRVEVTQKQGVGIVTGDLSEMLYDSEGHSVSAAEVGAMHKRERIFIIAHRDDSRNDTPSSEINQDWAKENKERREQPQLKPSGQVNAPNTNNTPRTRTEPQEFSDKGREPSLDGNNAVLDTSNTRGVRIQRHTKQKVQRIPNFSWCENIGSVKDLFNRQDIPEPLIRGKDNGIPHRVDRTKCLGNAVVPQVAQRVAEKLIELADRSRIQAK